MRYALLLCTLSVQQYLEFLLLHIVKFLSKFTLFAPQMEKQKALGASYLVLSGSKNQEANDETRIRK